jgi:hypothetical protein
MHQVIERAKLTKAGLALAIVLGVSSAGCLAIGGSDRYESKTPTLGKELQDLKTAHDSGAVSDAEYQQAKAKLLEGRH